MPSGCGKGERFMAETGRQKGQEQGRGKSFLNYVTKFAAVSKASYLRSVVLACIGVICSIVPYFVMGTMVKQLLQGERNYDVFLLEGGLMAVFIVLGILFHTLSTNLSHKTTFALIAGIRTELCEKLARLPLGTVRETPSGALKNIMIERTDAIETTLAHVVPEFTANLLAPFLMFLYLCRIDWRMALLSLVSIPVGMVFMAIVMRDYEEKYEGAVRTTDEMNAAVVEYISGIEVIKAFNQGAASYEKFSEKVRANASYYYHWMLHCQLPMSVGKVVSPTTLITILPVGWLWYQDGTLPMDVFIQTISLLFVLPLAKILSMTVLRHKETAPFIMEMPPYHIPSVRGVLGRAIERIWLYIRKITTVVAAVAVVLFVLLQFPGLTPERKAHYEAEKDRAVQAFLDRAKDKKLGSGLRSEDDVLRLILYQQGYKELLKSGASAEKKKAYGLKNPDFFEIIQNKKDPEAKALEKELKKLVLFRTNTLTAIRRERIDNSLLGKIGRALEPASRYAGFNWRVNVAVLSTLAAKENSVSTLGALYIKEPGEAGGAGKNTDTLEQRMKQQEGDLTPLHAMALMLFMVLCPPCLPTIMAIRVQTGSTGWMLFAFFVPLILGLLAAVLVFSGGSALGLSGFEAMWMFYLIPLTLTVLLGLIRTKRTYS